MLKLSKLTDYAVIVLVHLSKCDDVTTSPAVSVETNVPEPTVAKVLKALTASRIVISQRGAKGGYKIARPLEQISVADVIAAIDGPIIVAACVEGQVCEQRPDCQIQGGWDVVNRAIKQVMTTITLAEMTKHFYTPCTVCGCDARNAGFATESVKTEHAQNVYEGHTVK